jgi:hypothetical protein
LLGSGCAVGVPSQSGDAAGADGTSPEGAGLAAGGLGEQGGGGVAVGGALRLGVLAGPGPDPAALGGGTESPPTGAELLTALEAAGAVLEAGAPGLGFPAVPHATTSRLVSTAATAVARLAGIRLLCCCPAVL